MQKHDPTAEARKVRRPPPAQSPFPISRDNSVAKAVQLFSPISKGVAMTEGAEQTNDKLFPILYRSLQSGTPGTYIAAARKLAHWLGVDKAYYPQARPRIVELLETAHTTLCRTGVNPDKPFLPSAYAQYPKDLADAYIAIVRAVVPFLNLFRETHLQARVGALIIVFGSDGLPGSHSTQAGPSQHSVVVPSPSPSDTRSAPPALRIVTQTVPPMSGQISQQHAVGSASVSQTPLSEASPTPTAHIPNLSALLMSTPGASSSKPLRVPLPRFGTNSSFPSPSAATTSASLPVASQVKTPVVGSPLTPARSTPLPLPRTKAKKKLNIDDFIQADLQWFKDEQQQLAKAIPATSATPEKPAEAPTTGEDAPMGEAPVAPTASVSSVAFPNNTGSAGAATESASQSAIARAATMDTGRKGQEPSSDNVKPVQTPSPAPKRAWRMGKKPKKGPPGFKTLPTAWTNDGMPIYSGGASTGSPAASSSKGPVSGSAAPSDKTTREGSPERQQKGKQRVTDPLGSSGSVQRPEAAAQMIGPSVDKPTFSNPANIPRMLAAEHGGTSGKSVQEVHPGRQQDQTERLGISDGVDVSAAETMESVLEPPMKPPTGSASAPTPESALEPAVNTRSSSVDTSQPRLLAEPAETQHVSSVSQSDGSHIVQAVELVPVDDVPPDLTVTDEPMTATSVAQMSVDPPFDDSMAVDDTTTGRAISPDSEVDSEEVALSLAVNHEDEPASPTSSSMGFGHPPSSPPGPAAGRLFPAVFPRVHKELPYEPIRATGQKSDIGESELIREGNISKDVTSPLAGVVSMEPPITGNSTVSNSSDVETHDLPRSNTVFLEGEGAVADVHDAVMQGTFQAAVQLPSSPTINSTGHESLDVGGPADGHTLAESEKSEKYIARPAMLGSQRDGLSPMDDSSLPLNPATEGVAHPERDTMTTDIAMTEASKQRVESAGSLNAQSFVSDASTNVESSVARRDSPPLLLASTSEVSRLPRSKKRPLSPTSSVVETPQKQIRRAISPPQELSSMQLPTIAVLPGSSSDDDMDAEVDELADEPLTPSHSLFSNTVRSMLAEKKSSEGEVSPAMGRMASVVSLEEGEVTPTMPAVNLSEEYSSQASLRTSPPVMRFGDNAASDSPQELVVVAYTRGSSEHHLQLEFDISPEAAAKLAGWVERYDSKEIVTDSRCLSISCHPFSTCIAGVRDDPELTIAQLASATPASWPRDGRLWAEVICNAGKRVVVLSPPFQRKSETLVDISGMVAPGKNVLKVFQLRDFAHYVFIVQLHSPTASQLAELKQHRHHDDQWSSFMRNLTKYDTI